MRMRARLRSCIGVSRLHHLLTPQTLRCDGGALSALQHVLSKLLQQLSGTAVSILLALRSACFRLRSVFDCLEPYLAFSTLSQQALTDIQWLAELHVEHPENGMPIWPPWTSRTLWADALGETGWGAQLRWSGKTRHAHGYWRRGREASLHITAKELKTLRLALQSFLPEVRGRLLRRGHMHATASPSGAYARDGCCNGPNRVVWGNGTATHGPYS